MSFIGFFGSGATPISAVLSTRNQILAIERAGEGEPGVEFAGGDIALHLGQVRAETDDGEVNVVVTQVADQVIGGLDQKIHPLLLADDADISEQG